MTGAPQSQHVEPVQHWRDHLSDEDEREIQAWIRQSGLDRVARIVSVLASFPERGNQPKPDSVLLTEMARIKLADYTRSNHSIAAEVASNATASGTRHIAYESLVPRLRNTFSDQQFIWTRLAETSSPSLPARGGNHPHCPGEGRILARIIEMLPRTLNVYDALLADAKTLGDDELALVKAFGRKRAEPLLAERIRQQMRGEACTVAGRIPRSLYDLISPELDQFRAERAAAPNGVAKPPI